MNKPEVWEEILDNGGSVQTLDFLSNQQKEVFKTFSEIDPLDIIRQAADRQKYICQSQSLNLAIHPYMPLKDIHEVMATAWSLGVKSLYYQRSTNPSQQAVRSLGDCVACEA